MSDPSLARRVGEQQGRFSDSVSVIDVASARANAELPLGPPAQETESDRGQALFYDSRLSSDGWISCHSCHTDGHTCGLLNDNASDGGFGAPKRILSLLGVSNTGPWAWHGKVSKLDHQVRSSIETTLRGPDPTDADVRAIAAFLKTLSPPPSLAAARGTMDAAAIDRGRIVFERNGCAECHAPPAYTSPSVYDVGVADESGGREFNPPSLLGLSQRDRLLHNNRSNGLVDLLGNLRHGLDEPLPDDELAELIRFLESL